MAALVQTIPQQTGTVPVLQTRPASSSGSFTPSSSSSSPPQSHPPSHPPQHQQLQSARNSTMPWNPYSSVGSSSGSCRPGHQAVTVNSPSQPNPQNRQSWAPHLRPEHRAFSAPSIPQLTAPAGGSSHSVNHSAAGSVSSTIPPMHMSLDDSAIPTRKSSQQAVSDPSSLRPLSTVNPSTSSTSLSPAAAKPSPDRYRRGNRRAEGVAGAGAQSITNTPVPTASVDDSQVGQSRGHVRVSSADDTSRTDKPPIELAKRYRQRSWGNMDNAGLINLQLHLPSSSPTPSSGGRDYFDQTPQKDEPGSAQSSPGREGDSSPSSVKGATKPEDTKRVNKPSPLSQPVSPESSAPSGPKPRDQPKERSTPVGPMHSPATQRLAEMNHNELQKPGKSRLRRAFSFGSASELLKASNNAQKREAIAAEKARQEMLKEELGPEQAAIAEQQEASGLGESIYAHFNNSTDNLSVSSTASSASVMLRKMGKGMKRSTRSLVGLFRPKSIVSNSSTDAIYVEPSAPQLSMINIEADRQSVSVNPDPQELPRGGTVFPKVEPNASEAAGPEGTTADKQSRKSIIGGDDERAEVLAAVRKGILKKTHSSPALSTLRSAQASQPGSDSPHSSTPSTPEDQTRSGNRGVKIAGEDYFGASDTRSESGPPSAPKSLVFSPRIQLHETWTSGEYDRRGEIATCNRLTPLLAQQIKEELNNFKMEMEVHETSKVYTHFL